MSKPVVLVVDANRRNAGLIRRIIKKLDYESIYLSSLDELTEVINRVPVGAILINMDQFSMNNNFFLKLKKGHPDFPILGFSGRAWHPELAEAFSSSIFACLRYPIDPDELSYCLKIFFGVTGQENQFQI